MGGNAGDLEDKIDVGVPVDKLVDELGRPPLLLRAGGGRMPLGLLVGV